MVYTDPNYASIGNTIPTDTADQQQVNNLKTSPAIQYGYGDYGQRLIASNRAKYQTYLKSKKIQDISNLNDQMTYENYMQDMDRYIQGANNTYINSLQKTDANLADAIQKATESYGAGNLLGSGIQISRANELVGDTALDKQNLKDTQNDLIGKYSSAKAQATMKYQQVTQPLNQLQAPVYKPTQKESIEQYINNFINKSV